MSDSDLIEEVRVEENLWQEGVNDVGLPSTDNAKFKIFKGSDGRKYKLICKVADDVWKKMDSNRIRFERLPISSSKTQVVHKIGDMIFTERSLSSDRVYEYSQDITNTTINNCNDNNVTKKNVYHTFNFH